MPLHHFEELEVWKRSSRLAVSVLEATDSMKLYALRDQMARCCISIPSNIGKLEAVHETGSREVVILLQDAHSIPKAQRNIRNLIDFFQQSHGLKTIAV